MSPATLHRSPGHESGIRVEPDVDHYHAQITSEKELARAKRDGTPANLNAGQVAAVVRISTGFRETSPSTDVNEPMSTIFDS